MQLKATKLAAILSRLHSACRLPQATLALALAIAALASPARADGGLPSGYTALTDHNGGLYKAAAADQILVTDYYPNEKTWMEIDLEFGTSGNDGSNWRDSYFMGLAGFPNGHQLNGCLARYIGGNLETIVSCRSRQRGTCPHNCKKWIFGTCPRYRAWQSRRPCRSSVVPCPFSGGRDQQSRRIDCSTAMTSTPYIRC